MRTKNAAYIGKKLCLIGVIELILAAALLFCSAGHAKIFALVILVTEGLLAVGTGLIRQAKDVAETKKRKVRREKMFQTWLTQTKIAPPEPQQ